MDDEGMDELVGHLDARRVARAERVTGAEPIAGLALAVVSLVGIDPAQLFGQALLYHSHDFRGMAAAPGIAALIAAFAFWLGRRQIHAAESPALRNVGSAAMTVAAVSFVINVVAFVALITVSSNGLVGG